MPGTAKLELDATALLANTGPERRACRNLCSELNSTRIRPMGYSPQLPGIGVWVG